MDFVMQCGVVGRITEEHLDEAEKSFPGINKLYRALSNKPATFLQLVWMYETSQSRESRSFALS